MENEETESRYSHLLQPIRDLAENWSIDIASELEEYLEELENISFSFDLESNGATGKLLNFAEAALLIQGSASIYSKKVEYLHQLLFQTLNYLTEKKKNIQTKATADGNDVDNEEDVEEEFLTLDNLPEAEGIDLDETKEVRVQGNEYNANQLSLFISQQTNASLNGPSEGSDSTGDRRSDFRLNTCSLHKSGALLFEDRDRLLMNDFLERTDQFLANNQSLFPFPSNSQNDIVFNDNNNNDHSDDDNNNVVEFGNMNSDSDDESGTTNGDFMTLDDKPTDETSSNIASLAESQDRVADSIANKPSEENSNNKIIAAEGEEEEGEGESSTTRETRKSTRLQETALRKSQTKSRRIEETDPWEFLDPHDSSTPAKPFKKGKPCRAVEIGSQKKLENTQLLFLHHLFPATKHISNQKNGCDFPEFYYLYEKLRKVKQEERRKARLQNQDEEDTITAAIDNEVGRPVVEAFDPPSLVPEHNEDDDSDNDDVGFVGAMNDEDDDDDHVDVPLIGHLPQAWGGSVEYTATVPESYEDLCKSHVDRYMASVGEYIKETALSQRISEWRRRIEPILEEQDSHPVFDISAYGQSILKRCSKTDHADKISLRSVIAEKDDETLPSYEVCRNFLAILQLTNNGNVDIIPSGSLETMHLTLLSTKPRYDIENYRAPSLTEDASDE